MDIQYNPFDPDQVDHHQPVLARMRRECPVAEIAPGMFYLARHADIVDVCRRPQVFQQGRFIPIEQDTRTPDQLNLGETNPPEHTRVRKILAGLLSPPKVRPLEPRVRQICDELVDRFASRGEADMIADLGVPLPGAVIGPLTGLPEELYASFRSYSDDYMARTHPDPDVAAAALARVDEFDAIVRELIRERRAASKRPVDLLTGLVESVDDDGKPLSEDKILVHLTKDVIVGGTETTTHLIGNLFYNLCSTPGAYRRVHEDRSLIPAAVEETLRISGPVQVLFRNAVEDTTIRDVPIPAGSVVALGYASANRDEDVFDDPDTFSLDRGDDLRHQHFGFGFGIHYCVGAPLARLEATCALAAVLDRISDMQLAPGFEYERVRFFMMRGPQRVDVRFTPAIAA
ncbi:MAG TPA: cytochrome P450 [Acidimicrobiales bacterium]